jgi:hypothetical protein
MKWETTARFESDFKRLSPDERRIVRRAVERFNEACDRGIAAGHFDWPAALRVRAVEGAPGIWELTWSFSGPDGRATWEWVSIANEDGTTEPGVRWRRIGSHRIFDDP